MSDEIDPEEWDRRLNRPVTAGELSQAMQLVHLALLSHSAFEASLMEGDEAQQRRTGENAVHVAGQLLAFNRRLLGLPAKTDG